MDVGVYCSPGTSAFSVPDYKGYVLQTFLHAGDEHYSVTIVGADVGIVQTLSLVLETVHCSRFREFEIMAMIGGKLFKSVLRVPPSREEDGHDGNIDGGGNDGDGDDVICLD